MYMANYLVAGGTGFVGKHIVSLLQQEGHTVYILSTQKHKCGLQADGSTIVYWNPTQYLIDPSFQLSDGILINLAGAGVADQRWTSRRKKEILQSRVQSLETLYKAVQNKQLSILYMVSASAIGFYGDRDTLFQETDLGDDSFLSQVCQQWELTANQFDRLQIPHSIVRIGIVLGSEAGALPALQKPLSWGVAAIPGSGKQIYSWIHVQDLARLLYFLSTHKKIGVYNAVAPYPCSLNALFAAFIKTNAVKAILIHVPELIIKIMLGGMSIEVLKSARVSSQKIEETGFQFLYPDIDSCLLAINKHKHTSHIKKG